MNNKSFFEISIFLTFKMKEFVRSSSLSKHQKGDGNFKLIFQFLTLIIYNPSLTKRVLLFESTIELYEGFGHSVCGWLQKRIKKN